MPSYFCSLKEWTLAEFNETGSILGKATEEPTAPSLETLIKSALTGKKTEGKFNVPTLAGGEKCIAATIHVYVKAGAEGKRLKFGFVSPAVFSEATDTVAAKWLTVSLSKAQAEALTQANLNEIKVLCECLTNSTLTVYEVYLSLETETGGAVGKLEASIKATGATAGKATAVGVLTGKAQATATSSAKASANGALRAASSATSVLKALAQGTAAARAVIEGKAAGKGLPQELPFELGAAWKWALTANGVLKAKASSTSTWVGNASAKGILKAIQSAIGVLKAVLTAEEPDHHATLVVRSGRQATLRIAEGRQATLNVSNGRQATLKLRS